MEDNILKSDLEKLNEKDLENNSKNDIFTSRYTIVDNNFADDNSNSLAKSNQNLNLNSQEISANEINNKNLISNKQVKDSKKLRKNLIEITIILLGEASVGKTSIVERYLNNSFSEKYKCTVNVDFKTKIINEDENTSVKLNIRDTAGQEKFRSLTKAYYHDCEGAFIIFDLTRKNTFNYVQNWINELNNNANKDINIIILGNKLDLSVQRDISSEDIKKAFQNEYYYFDVSAKNGNNISLAFEKMIKLILETKEIKERIMGNYNKNEDKKIDLNHNDKLLKKEKQNRCC